MKMKNYRNEMIMALDQWLEGAITSIECIRYISSIMIEYQTDFNIREGNL